MSSPRQDRHLAVWNPRLERERARMRRILAAAEDDGRAGDARLMILGVRPRVRLELADDRLEIGVRVALREHVGEIARQRRRPEGRTEVVERVAPAIVHTVLAIGLDATMGERL